MPRYTARRDSRITITPTPSGAALTSSMCKATPKNAPERTWQDMADIGYLLALAGIDRREVREYFVKAGLEGRWDDLARTL